MHEKCETEGCAEPVHGERFCINHHAVGCPALQSWTGGMRDRADVCMCWAHGKPEKLRPNEARAIAESSGGLQLRCGRTSRRTGVELGCSLPQGHKGRHDFTVEQVRGTPVLPKRKRRRRKRRGGGDDSYADEFIDHQLAKL